MGDFDFRRILTDRLVIRQWQDTDREPFAQMSQDTEVMRYFPKHLTIEESMAMIDKSVAMLEKDKFGYWALEEKDSANFLGFVALVDPKFESDFTPCLEIGWRLKASAWGKGFASEGAKALLEYGFMALGLNEIVSMTAKVNTRSVKVMERIGMSRNVADDFDHPRVAEGSPLRPHVLYRLSKSAWIPIRSFDGTPTLDK